MKKIIIAVSIFLCTYSLQAQSVWIDGPGDSIPNGDRGRGNTDWNAHYQFGISGTSNKIPGFIKDRMIFLKATQSRSTYARLYADITYLVASYGLKSAKWVDGSDAAAPADDRNRALMNWSAHRDYVEKSAGYDSAAKLLGDRLTALKAVLSKEEYARCYADCSILLVNFSRMK